jgi:hypothetical protein
MERGGRKMLLDPERCGEPAGTVPAKSLGRSCRNSMKRAINSVKAVYCWYLCIEALTVLVSGHSPFINPGGYADFPQPPWHRLPELDLGQRSVTSRTWSLTRQPGCRKPLIVRGAWSNTCIVMYANQYMNFRNFLIDFLHCFLLLRKCKRFTFTKTAAKQKVFVL